MYRTRARRRSGTSALVILGFTLFIFALFYAASWSTMIFFGVLHHEVPIVVGDHVARISSISIGSAMQLVAPGFFVAAVVQFVVSLIKD